MSDLGLNKYLGAGLATALGLMGLVQLPQVVFGAGAVGHHGDDHGEAQTLAQKMCAQFSYCVEIAEAATVEDPVEVYDLGQMMLSAEASVGERVFGGQCVTCHSIEAGGANGTGPNLHAIVGTDKAVRPGFNYSGALAAAEGAWTYENLDAWLKNPAAYVKGTSMSFAGLRKDSDRAGVLAYLAANTPGAPAFPAPMAAAPAPEAAPSDGTAVAPDGEAAPAGTEAPAEGAAPAAPPAGEAAPAGEIQPT